MIQKVSFPLQWGCSSEVAGKSMRIEKLARNSNRDGRVKGAPFVNALCILAAGGTFHSVQRHGNPQMMAGKLHRCLNGKAGVAFAAAGAAYFSQALKALGSQQIRKRPLPVFERRRASNNAHIDASAHSSPTAAPKATSTSRNLAGTGNRLLQPLSQWKARLTARISCEQYTGDDFVVLWPMEMHGRV